HWPLVHCEPAVHVVPLALAPHIPDTQEALLQSVPAMHPLPTLHVLPRASQFAPPQSTSVSLPSFTPSMHETQVPGPLPKQMLFTQSPFTLQCFWSGHLAQLGPPQSTSVSPPFCTVS